MVNFQNCTASLIIERVNLANCLSQNVGLRLEIDDLRGGNVSKENIDQQQLLKNCFENCNNQFSNPEFCGSQCEIYRGNCFEKCQTGI